MWLEYREGGKSQPSAASSRRPTTPDGALRVADDLEPRGPIGGPFTWRIDDGGPLLLVADGSGLVPLMAMLRHRAAKSSTVDAHLLISTGSPAEVLYRSELMRLAANGESIPQHDRRN